MKYAVIKIAGKQYRVTEGEILTIDKQEAAEGEEIEISEVLLLSDGENVEVGTSYVKDIKVKAQVEKHLKGEKIRVAKFKAKSRYHKVMGFRPLLTRIKILKIESKKTS